MKLGEIFELAEFLGQDVDFIACWQDNFYEDDSHDGESAGFADPRTAFAMAKEKAEAVGQFGVTYFIQAMIGDDVRIENIDGFFETLKAPVNMKSRIDDDYGTAPY